jgi:hypothetical protein
LRCRSRLPMAHPSFAVMERTVCTHGDNGEMGAGTGSMGISTL